MSQAQAIVNAKCLACHSGDKPDRMVLTDLTTLDEMQTLKVFKQVATKQMPKDSAESLSDEEINAFMVLLLGGDK